MFDGDEGDAFVAAEAVCAVEAAGGWASGSSRCAGGEGVAGEFGDFDGVCFEGLSDGVAVVPGGLGAAEPVFDGVGCDADACSEGSLRFASCFEVVTHPCGNFECHR